MPEIKITQEMLLLVDEFKGKWQALNAHDPDQLAALRKVATIESIGSSTRIYTEVMDLVFTNWDAIPITENYLKK